MALSNVIYSFNGVIMAGWRSNLAVAYSGWLFWRIWPAIQLQYAMAAGESWHQYCQLAPAGNLQAQLMAGCS